MRDELSMEEWVASLPGCEECGVIDVMNAIEGLPICAACALDEMRPDDEYDDGSEEDV